jgi:hypothetical protein
MSEEEQLLHVRKHLECPVCFEIRRGVPIFECDVGGHTICAECHHTMHKRICPICKAGLACHENLQKTHFTELKMLFALFGLHGRL